MTGSALAVTRVQQLAGFVLSTMPLAERMLLYQVAMAASIMLPIRLTARR